MTAPALDGADEAAAASRPAAGGAVVFPLPRRLAYPGAVLCGLLYWLAFPGKEQSTGSGLLALLAFAPLWIALQGQAPRRAAFLGVLAGATMNLAGFYWLLEMLQTFGGFPTPVCMFFVLVVCLYQGGRIGLMGWLYARASGRGWRRSSSRPSRRASSSIRCSSPGTSPRPPTSCPRSRRWPSSAAPSSSASCSSPRASRWPSRCSPASSGGR